MKLKLYIFLIVLLPLSVSGGQMPQLSQYMLNRFFINPAIAGTYNRYIIKTSYRYQWVGFGPEAPQIINFSVFGPHNDLNMGYGGYVYSDNTGPTSRNGIMGSFAYNFPIADEMHISLGLSLGLMQYNLDGSEIVLGQTGDPLLLEKAYTDYVPDANIGAYLWSSSYYAGISSQQLFGNRLDIVEAYGDTLTGINALKRHYYIVGGYLITLNREWSVEPSALITASYAQPIILELSTRAVYMGMVWAGLSFRTGDKLSTFSILASYKHERKYEFGISYDLNVAKTDRGGYGSVEVLIGYWFDKIK